MKYSASKTALLGLLFALSVILSFIESVFAGLIPIPGIKPGLSNIVTMYCVFCLGKREAYTLAGLKAFFVLLTRGPTGAFMSLAGGICSVAVMNLFGGKLKCGPLFVSVSGGVSHNIGQLLMASLLMKSGMVFYYFPILAISGVGMGILTGFLLRYLMPHFKNIFMSPRRNAE